MNPEEPKQELVPAPQATEARSVTKFTAEHGREVGLPSPEAVNYMMSVAKLLLDSSLVTKDMGDTIEQIRSNALAKMLIGHELGMQPMESLQSIDIVKGKIFIRYPQLINQLILRGFNIKWLERSNERAALRLTHKDPAIEPEEFEFTFEDAKRAGLVYADSQYIKRPRVMLTARVVSEAYRSTGGNSNVYTPEERHEITGNGGNQEREPQQPEADPYAVTMPEPPILKPESAAPAARILISDKTSERPAVVSEPRDTTSKESSNHTTTDATAGGKQSTAAAQTETATAEPAISATGTAESPAPETKVREMPKPKIDPHVGPLMAEIEKLLPVKGRKKIVEEYLRGYFNTGDIKAVLGDPGMLTALRFLQALALSDQWKTPLAGDPHKLGVDAAAGCAKLLAYMEGWPEDCQETAFKIALARYPDDASGLAEYLADPIQAETLGFGDLRAFLWVLDKVGAKYATMFRERSVDMAATAADWTGVDLSVAMIEALPPESEPQQNLLDLIRKGAAE